MREDLQELWKFRELLFAMVQREIKIRYKNSALGFLWSFVTPLATTVVMWMVFKIFGAVSVDSYSIYFLAAFLPFQFFQQAILDSSQSVLGAIHMVKKVYFPREILPLAAVASNFIHFCLAMVVFFLLQGVLFIVHPQVNPFQPTALLLPLFAVVLLAYVVGISLIVSALNTFYEDVKYMLSVGMYLQFYLTPIIYFSEMVRHSKQIPGQYSELVYVIYHLNPICALVTCFRRSLVAPSNLTIGTDKYRMEGIDWSMFGFAAVISFSTLFIGYAVFNRFKWRFMERP